MSAVDDHRNCVLEFLVHTAIVACRVYELSVPRRSAEAALCVAVLRVTVELIAGGGWLSVCFSPLVWNSAAVVAGRILVTDPVAAGKPQLLL